MKNRQKLLMGGRVLVISQDEEKRIQLANIIEQQGFETREAENHGAGTKLCRVFHPDAIVLHVEDLKSFKYKTDKNFPGADIVPTPILLVVHSDKSNPRQSSAIMEGADEIFCWPVDSDGLVRKLKAAIELHRYKREVIAFIADQEAALDSIRKHNSAFALELEEAQEVQLAMGPKQHLILNGFAVNFAIRAAQKLNGDFIDIFKLDSVRIALILIDVSGHGAAASMITGMAHAWLHSTLHTQINLAEATEELHRYLLGFTPEQMYATGFIGILDTKTGKLEYVLAGHPEPLFWHNGVCRPGPQSVTSPLGLHEEFRAVVSCCHIKPGDALMIYSDGMLDAFVDAPDVDAELCCLYAQHNSGDLCLRNRRCCMADDILRKGRIPEDDMTMLCLTRFPEPLVIGDLTISISKTGCYEVRFPSGEEALQDLHSFLTNNLQEEIGEPVFWDILQVVMELTRNAVEWGNGINASKIICCSILVTDREIILTVEDEGEGFDTAVVFEKSGAVAQGPGPVDGRPGGGFGIAIAMGLADHLVFNEKGNRVTVRFVRNRA